MSTQALELSSRPQTAIDIRAQVNLIQEVMKAVMKEKVHYGVIPGCDKPSLYKPGAEKLLSTFRIAIEPIVEDLSTADQAHYRVITRATSMGSGTFLGAGVGEASSAEEKYQWREVVCEEEWEATPEDRRRTKWRKGWNGKPANSVRQVRTNVADIANTVLKMAKKRSQMDVTLTVTAASDVFNQDLEDIPEEVLGSVVEESGPAPVQQTQRKAEAPAQSKTQAAPAANSNGNGKRVISENQAKRFYAMSKGGTRSAEEIRNELGRFGFSSDREITTDKYEELCDWVNK